MASGDGALLPLRKRGLRVIFDKGKWMVGNGYHLSGGLFELNQDDGRPLFNDKDSNIQQLLNENCGLMHLL
jgi:hypothetical protein